MMAACIPGVSNWPQQGEEAFPGKGHQTPTEEEFRQLRSENERLKQERDILKKAIAIFKPAARPKMKYQFIEEQRLEFPVRVLCEVLEVKRKRLLRVAKTPELGSLIVVKRKMKS